MPIHAVMDSQWHTPKAPGTRSTQTLSLKLSDVQVQPAFGHIPLIHTATQLIKASKAPAVNDQQPIPVVVPPPEAVPQSRPWAETLSEDVAADLPSHLSIASAASVASTVAAASAASVSAARAVASHVPFRPSCMHVTAEIESLAVALVDDRYGHPIEVMAVRLQVGGYHCTQVAWLLYSVHIFSIHAAAHLAIYSLCILHTVVLVLYAQSPAGHDMQH